MAFSKKTSLPNENISRLAVDVAIFNDKKEVLLGKRLSTAGLGMWGFPGGRLLPGEKLIDCADRELREELGPDILVELTDEILAVRDNSLSPNFIPHVTIILKGRIVSGSPRVVEENKCSEWRFIPIENLHQYSLFSGVNETLKNYIKKSVRVVTDWQSLK